MASEGNVEIERIHDVGSILFSESRDYLIRSNGDQIKADQLRGKVVGLYFSASWCGPCRRFTPILIDLYNELKTNNKFEIIFCSADEDNESFEEYFSKMPWLAVPYSDSETRDRMDELFSVNGIPHLVLLDENGKVLSDEGVQIIQDYGAAGFPFTSKRIDELKEQDEEAKRNQSLKSLLVSQSRDYVIASDGRKVAISELEGKTVGLYFALAAYEECQAFTSKLVKVYTSLKEKGESFEIVMVPLDDDEQSFVEAFEQIPWFSLPVKDSLRGKLIRYFELQSFTTLVIIGPDGKTRHPDVSDAIVEHGEKAYPFTPEKLSELEKAKRDAQTLESLLVSDDCDFVIGKDGSKVPVSDLVGRTVLLYFSAHWCPPCRAFLPKLRDAYDDINKNGKVMEVVFISRDRDQTSFDEFFSTMPWLALPFGDGRVQSLGQFFKLRGIPMVVAIGPNGKTVTTEARELIMCHGAEAYPFTPEKIEEIEAGYEKMAEGWPKKSKTAAHSHELVLSKRHFFVCDGCEENGHVWSYFCETCDYDLHPKCALEEENEDEGKGKGKDEGEGQWVCDGDKCYKE
ncbi:probable nucleoredoxin 1 [Andrographis paniculata]|uniref:probable nucleoredoxin 1 n=1 Tax=Andrographis paniculata TaxID=175694 RepID=UPI0021E75824|nr:probable nucleoredoxin 1 [Andrographis paniculata]